jgi:hypothetical protein
MGRGALDMAVVWLTEESEHAAVRLHLYGLCETHTDDGWDACLDAAAVACSLLCLSAARSLSSSGLVPPHPSPPLPSTRTAASSSCSCSRRLIDRRGVAVAVTVRLEAAGRPAVSPPETLSCLLLELRWPALWNKVLLNFRQLAAHARHVSSRRARFLSRRGFRCRLCGFR